MRADATQIKGAQRHQRRRCEGQNLHLSMKSFLIRFRIVNVRLMTKYLAELCIIDKEK